jgi:hypothetical protein
MKAPIAALLLLFVVPALAGDGADGPNRYEADFTREPQSYQMTKADARWTASLLNHLKEKTKPAFFTRTDLVLHRDGTAVEGQVYRCVSKPEIYYFAEGDTMLNLTRGLIYSPGVGGFSMHAPQSRAFIACLNLESGGVPVVRHSPITREPLWWFGNQRSKRLDH